MMKHTPKSCSCRSCQRGKHTRSGRILRKLDERAYRHNSKTALNKLGEDANFNAAPIGNYYD